MSRELVTRLVGLVFCLTFCFGATPLGTGFTYQGQLKQLGVPSQGPTNMVFKLFDASSAGNLLGTQTINNVPVKDGFFTVTLNAAGEFGASAFSGDSRWLEIAVNGFLLSPRQELKAAPYALKTRGVDGHSLDASDGSPVDALVVDTAGNVGIGTSAPEDRLHIFKGDAGATLSNANASVIIEDDASTYLNFMTPSDNESGILFGLGGVSSASGGIIYNNASNPTGMQFRTGGNATRMVIDSTGQVGIGTTAPTERLHVSGNALITGTLDVTGAAGDGTVVLPAKSISADETLDEPGLANDIRTNLVTLTLTGTVVLSRTITTPSSGFVVAYVTARVEPGVIIGSAEPTLLIDKTTAPAAESIGASVVLGSLEMGHISSHAVFAVSAGANTFEVFGRSFFNDCDISSRELTLMFFPTAYGTTDVED